MQQIFGAVQFMHSKNIVHCLLVPQKLVPQKCDPSRSASRKKVMRQIIVVVQFIHSYNIGHRDLKVGWFLKVWPPKFGP